MSSKPSLLLSSLETNTTKAVTGVTIRQITSIKQQLSTSSFPSHPEHSNVPSLIKVKAESSEDEIKEYAAKAMSELLGWYGYDKVDSKCTHGLNLDHFESLTRSKHNCNHQQQSYHPSHIIGSNCVNNPNSTDAHSHASAVLRAAQSLQLRTSQSPSTSSISVVSNREIDVTQTSPSVSLTTAPASPRALENSDSASDVPDSPTICSWCGRTGGTWEPGNAALTCSIINNSGRFCSEACFAAGRRAAFKRARTCDWCRHIRHSVSYVDFQDGECQLQFCSDKCLNQYKMNIFCRETQAHLALHGLVGLSSNNPNTSGGLITPELWLRDCRSPTIPPPNSTEDEALMIDDEPIIWPEANVKNRFQIHRISKNNENQLFNDTSEIISGKPQQLYDFEDTSNDKFVEETEQAIKESLKDEEDRKIAKCREMNTLISLDASIETDSPVTYKQSQSPREYSKEPSTDYSREGTIYLKDVRKLLEKGVEKMSHQTSIYESRKISKSPTQQLENETIYQIPPRGITIEQPHLSHPMPIKFTPRSENILKSSSMTMKAPQLHYLHDRYSTNSKAGLLPPVTVLVPYPIPIPIPLPIPIPIPLFGTFFDSKNYNLRETKDNNTTNVSATDINVEIPIVPEDLSQRGKTKNLHKINTRKQVQSLNVVETTTIVSDSSKSSSPAHLSVATSCAPFSTMTTPDILPKLPITPKNINSKPLRKRRRQSIASDQIDMGIKLRSKFVPS